MKVHRNGSMDGPLVFEGTDIDVVKLGRRVEREGVAKLAREYPMLDDDDFAKARRYGYSFYTVDECEILRRAREGDAQGLKHHACAVCGVITWIEVRPEADHRDHLDYLRSGYLCGGSTHENGKHYCSDHYAETSGAKRCKCGSDWIWFGPTDVRFHTGVHSLNRCTPRKPLGTTCFCKAITARDPCSTVRTADGTEVTYGLLHAVAAHQGLPCTDVGYHVPWQDGTTLHDAGGCVTMKDWLEGK